MVSWCCIFHEIFKDKLLRTPSPPTFFFQKLPPNFHFTDYQCLRDNELWSECLKIYFDMVWKIPNHTVFWKKIQIPPKFANTSILDKSLNPTTTKFPIPPFWKNTQFHHGSQRRLNSVKGLRSTFLSYREENSFKSVILKFNLL